MNRRHLLSICVVSTALCCSILLHSASDAAVTTIQRNATIIGSAAQTGVRLGDLGALTEMSGQIYGAGKGSLALIGENGAVTGSVKLSVTEVAGLAPFQQGRLLVGDAATNTVLTADPKTGQTSKLFAISEIRRGSNPRHSVLDTGKLASLAFDGTNVYMGVKAGYSSSILKINPTTKEITGHTWSPGPNPTAMSFSGGNLFVLDGDNQQLRRYSNALVRSLSAVSLPANGRGLLIRNGDVIMLAPEQSGMIRQRVDLSQLALNNNLSLAGSALAGKIKRVDPGLLTVSRAFAVLICGDVAESGYNEFWNDTMWMYKTLREAGYDRDNIYVLYGYGVDHNSANPRYKYGEGITDFSATIANINMVFNGLKNGDDAHGIAKMLPGDTLFVWTFDHGSGSNPAYLCLWDGNMSDFDFAAKLNAVPYSKRAIFMQQCRSGGFIDNLSSANTFISTACRPSENAHRADTENENYNGAWYCHGEYNYHIISALSGKNAIGGLVNADTNADGKVCSAETHQWNTSHENQVEVPMVSNQGGTGEQFFIK